jgi:hypothetical protein
MTTQRNHDEMWDPQSEALAEHFHADERTSEAEHERRVESLAIAIQRAVEAWYDGHTLPGTLDDPEVQG